MYIIYEIFYLFTFASETPRSDREPTGNDVRGSLQGIPGCCAVDRLSTL